MYFKSSAVLLAVVSVFVVAITACKKKNNEPPVVINPPPDVATWPADSIRTLQNKMEYPWDLTWAHDDKLWITERGGKIVKLNPRDSAITFSYTITEVVSRGEGGLLGLAEHPEFKTNPFIYVVYNYNNTAGAYREKVVRFTVAAQALTQPTILLDNIPAGNIHNGSRLLITPDKKLLITTGDASTSNLSQNVNSLAGKILRINLDGTVPADNPIPNNPLWSYGHRNPQGLVLALGNLYASEHGPDIEDEINIIESNRNFGWPNVNGPCDGNETTFCRNNNVKEPLKSSGASTLAYCGMDFYGGSRIAQFKNALLLTTLKNRSLEVFTLDASGKSIIASKQYFKNTFGRLRDVCVAPSGRIYICTSNGNNADKIIEVQRL
jgi:glucose/arabinose dehydrogenase